MPRFNHQEGKKMFSDDILEKILCRTEVMRIPCEYKSTMLHAVADVLEKEDALKEDDNYAVYEQQLY